jgi:hypothetical protein
MMIKPFATLTVFPLLLATLQAQTPKENQAASTVTKATNAAEAVLKKLPSIPGAADAKVINIHIGDNYTFGFDEGVDAEEWGMTDNQNESGQAAAATGQPAAAATPNEKPPAYRKLDFRNGHVVLIATEQPVDSPKQVESPTATITAPETGAAPTSTPTAQPVPIATP